MRIKGKQAALFVLGILVLGTLGIWLSMKMMRFTFNAAVDRNAWSEHLQQTMEQQGETLEVAVIAEPATLERRPEFRWWEAGIGAQYTAIRVPAVHRYEAKLTGSWDVMATGSIFRVNAPPPLPLKPPEIQFSGVERTDGTAWSRLETGSVDPATQAGIKDELTGRANDPALLNRAREEGRKSIAEFVKQWLVAGGKWGKPNAEAIFIRYMDEEPVLSPEPGQLHR